MWSDGSRLLDDEDPGRPHRVGNMFVAILGDEDASGLQPSHVGPGLVTIVHVNCSIENNEDLDAVVGVPDIGFVVQ